MKAWQDPQILQRSQKKSPSDDCLKGCTQFSWPLQFKLRNPNSSRKCAILLKAGLLTPGSSYFLRLPTRLKPNSGISQISFPVTAAGPLPILTGFPIMPKRHLSETYTRSANKCQGFFDRFLSILKYLRLMAFGWLCWSGALSELLLAADSTCLDMHLFHIGFRPRFTWPQVYPHSSVRQAFPKSNDSCKRIPFFSGKVCGSLSYVSSGRRPKYTKNTFQSTKWSGMWASALLWNQKT